jgi:hypothetical protein
VICGEKTEKLAHNLLTAGKKSFTKAFLAIIGSNGSFQNYNYWRGRDIG